jgi:hypothetical protein
MAGSFAQRPAANQDTIPAPWKKVLDAAKPA